MACADSKCHSTKGTVGRRVRVAAHDRHAGLGEAELRADDVDDALLGISERVQRDTELRAVAAQCVNLRSGDRVCDRLVDVDRGDVVVLRREGEVGPTDTAARDS